MSFETATQFPGILINIVVKIGNQYFARFPVDSGLSIETKWLLVDQVNFAKAVLDLRNIKTSIPTDSFTIIDEKNIFTEFILAPNNKYLNSEVLIYTGVKNGSFPWEDYVLIARSFIKEIKKINNSWSITLRGNVELTSKPIWNVQNTLAKEMLEFDDKVFLESSIFFPASGTLKIDDEIINYSANDTASGVLSGLNRGLYGSQNDSTRITVKGDLSNDLDGKYFLINTPTQGYAIWYKSFVGTAPGAYPFNIEVDIATNASANDVAQATINAVNLSTVFSATSSGEQIIITSTAPGPTIPAQDSNTGFKFAAINLSIQQHKKGKEAISIRVLEENPITALLQLMISNGGGGLYDVLSYGLGINPNQIDVAGIENIRAIHFPIDVYRFFIFGVSSGQEFFENNICLPTNTRLTNDNGLITLVYIDQNTLYDYVADESVIIGIPQWSVSVDKVINRLRINYDYNPGINTFEKNSIFEDAQSITDYGKKESIFEFKGIYSDLNGLSIVNQIGSRLLIRLKDPRVRIDINTFFAAVNTKLGKTVKLVHRYVPGDKSLGSDTDMTILEKGIDFNRGVVSFSLYYTTISASGVKRFGVIAPNEPITFILSQRTFDVRAGSWYAQGYKISIDGELRIIRLLNGNTITVDIAFTVPLAIGKKVNIVEYNLASQSEKDRYAFVSPNTGRFDDNGLPYQLTP